MDTQWFQAALWIGLALLAAVLSVRIAISIALLEIIVGVIGGNFLPMHRTEWVNFLAGFGSILLTFLAGAEVDPEVMKKKFKESMTIGVFSFLAPFLGVMAYAYYVAGWSLAEAQIAGIALLNNICSCNLFRDDRVRIQSNRTRQDHYCSHIHHRSWYGAGAGDFVC